MQPFNQDSVYLKLILDFRFKFVFAFCHFHKSIFKQKCPHKLAVSILNTRVSCICMLVDTEKYKTNEHELSDQLQLVQPRQKCDHCEINLLSKGLNKHKMREPSGCNVTEYCLLSLNSSPLLL